LVLQTILLPLALKGRAPSHVTITGGTHVKASPSFHFLNTTWRAYLAKMGIHADLQMLRPGFYPRGGGIIEAEIQPCDRVQPLQLMSVGTDGAIEVTGFSAVAGLPESIAERQVRQAEMRLRSQRIQTSLAIEIWPGGPGTVIGLELQTPPAPSLFVAIGERGKPAERVADQAVNEMLAHLAADPYAVEAHSADQIVLPLALAEGPSAYRVSVVTQHLLTNIAVIQRFLDRKISCAGAEGEAGVVRID
jgi:RNA 3'-terminal phosphate cyclase (ATP)